MLELKNVSITLPITDRSLLENLTLTLHPGDKAAIIGEEGNGKSTLIKLIHDETHVANYCEYSGQITKKGTVGYLPQTFPEESLDTTVEEYFHDADLPVHAHTLSRLGLTLEFATSPQPIRTLSGGEKIKIQLAKILFADPDILLLDEPTNDLDLPTLEWLERFIKTSHLPILFISHDETLLENTANIIIHMEQLVRKTKSKVTVAKSGYAKYVKTRNLAYDKQTQVAKKQRADHKAQMARWKQIHDKVDHQQKSISRQDPATGRLLKKKMKAVKSTGRRLEKGAEDFLEIPETEEAILTQFDPAITIPQGKTVLALEVPSLYIGEKRLADSISLNVTGPQRIGIIGTNGTGKSTLLKKIWEAMRDRTDLTTAYMPQDYADALDYSKSAIDFLAADAHKSTITKVRTYLGSMKFTADEMLGPIAKLSGGQKAKILFTDMVLKGANVLVLDEPTRNFSPLSAPEIRRTLTNFGGAVISVSHDRKYLEEACDVVYELTKEGLQRSNFGK